MVDVNEIKRIVDDFETKARQKHDEAELLFKQGYFNKSVQTDSEAHSFEYCSAVLRQVL